MYRFIFLLLLPSLFACESEPDAKAIISQAIEAHGGSQYETSHISFDFRERHYDIYLDGGRYVYERTWDDSLGRAHDRLDNQGFVREINGEKADLSEEDQKRYSNGINAVVYFALLPFGLEDPAVNATYLGVDTVAQEPYHHVRVTFDESGGGKDHEDVFIYWFHQDNYTMDYLAYEYNTDGGGTRFREAYNVRQVNGIRFADYINYTDTLNDFALEDYDEQFEDDQVEEFSRIELANIEVEPVEQASVAWGGEQ